MFEDKKGSTAILSAVLGVVVAAIFFHYMNIGKLCGGIGEILVGWTACVISGVFWSVNPALTLLLLGLGMMLGGYGFKEVEECFTKSS